MFGLDRIKALEKNDMEYRIAVINPKFTNESMAGWGWSLGGANIPVQFVNREQADDKCKKLSRESSSGGWEFLVIEGPPFILPEPQNKMHASRKELSRNSFSKGES